MILADLGTRRYPKSHLAPEAMNDATLTDFQKRALQSMAGLLNHSGSADEIAWRLGYRPASRGRLAVSRALRLLLNPESHDGAVGRYVVRLAPRDQWGSATWCLRHEHVLYVDVQGRPCRYVSPGTEETLNGGWVLI